MQSLESAVLKIRTGEARKLQRNCLRRVSSTLVPFDLRVLSKRSTFALSLQMTSNSFFFEYPAKKVPFKFRERKADLRMLENEIRI